MQIDDTLSRAYLNEPKEELLESELDVCTLAHLPVSEEKLQKFKVATSEDIVLQYVK